MTILKDIRPDIRKSYNIMCRVNFVSFGGFSEQQGDYMITCELIDGTTVNPMKLIVLGRRNARIIHMLNVDDVIKLRNVCATEFAGEVTLVADGSRVLTLITMNVRAPECRALPSALPPLITSIRKALQGDVEQVNLFVRVERVVYNAIVVTDHTGAEGSVHLHHQVRDCPFTQGMLLCLRKVIIHNGALDLQPSSAVEEISEETFDQAKHRPPAPDADKT